jgi:hypothetical protein
LTQQPVQPRLWAFGFGLWADEAEQAKRKRKSIRGMKFATADFHWLRVEFVRPLQLSQPGQAGRLIRFHFSL